MIKCARCGTVLDCGCKGPESKKSTLENKPGAIWVHITDDAGGDVAGIGVERGFPPTTAKGLAIRDPLKVDTYPVTLAALSPTDTDKYDLPTDRDYEVSVQNGTIAHVDYTLFRKATLGAEFVLRSDEGTRFQGSTITVKAERLAEWSNAATPSPLAKTSAKSDKGLADLGPVSAGKYKLTPDYSALDKRDQFDVEETPQTLDLAPAGAKTVKFHVQQKAALKVEIVYKRPKVTKLPKKYLDDFVVPINIEADTGKKDSKGTDKGIADFGWVLPGKYKIQPDYSGVDVCKYDWPLNDSRDGVELKPGDNDPVVFEVEPLYQQVQFVAHCIFAIPDQVYQETPGDSKYLNITKPQPGQTGPTTFTYKTQTVPVGKYTKEDLRQCLQGMATLQDERVKMSAFLTKPVTKAVPIGVVTMAEIQNAAAAICTINDQGVVGPLRDKTQDVPFAPTTLTGSWKGRYHGKPVDKEDVDGRVTFVKDVLQKAHAQAVDDPKVLKVMLFPECFFQGLYGAYPLDETGYLVSELQKAVAGEDWRDWVFGFGTVNTVYAAYMPAPRERVGPNTLPDLVTAESTAQDMNNHAIVVRGGLGGNEDAARMIQKLVNSAELADDIIPDPGALRPQAVNATVQFGDTANDQVWIRVLTDILRQEIADGSPGKLFVSKGMPANWWKAPVCTHGLLDELGVLLNEWGMARLIRAIRVCANPSTLDWGDWTFVSRESAKIDLSKASNKTVLPKLPEAVLAILKKEWDRQEATAGQQPFDKDSWLTDGARRAEVLLELNNKGDQAAANYGFKLSYQQTAISTQIGVLQGDDLAAKAFVPAELPPNLTFAPTIFPLWKKLLEFWAAKQSKPTGMDIDNMSISLNDYCFAAPRKAAPWYSALDKARSIVSCKRLVFGLEICADHAAQRIKNINTGTSTIGIDIHMVPSAGMKPMYLATRFNGFLINCDGWSTKLEEGGKNMEVTLDGPSPYFYFNEIGSKKPVTPVYPHSAVCKRTSAVEDTSGVAEWLRPSATAIPDADLAKVIFGKGPGELHVYDPQDLPR